MSGRFGRVAVLLGGPSAEREVSLKSGGAVLEALRRSGVHAVAVDADGTVLDRLRAERAERAFIALHGRWGEDGVIQGALEVAGIPYTGSGVLGSALAMDKLRSKQLWQGAGIPTPAYVELGGDIRIEQVVDGLGLPLFVKPSREGSSIGVSRVDTIDQLEAAWEQARLVDDRVIAERCIQGIELTVGVLGEEALPTIRLETPRTFYDYEAKYLSDTTRYLCPCGLDGQIERRLQEQSLAAFRLLDCSGWGRVDLMLDANGNPYFLEVNTVPGMTDHSLVPMAARAAGIEFDELVLRILETSL